jgi:hypothetical protein
VIVMTVPEPIARLHPEAATFLSRAQDLSRAGELADCRAVIPGLRRPSGANRPAADLRRQPHRMRADESGAYRFGDLEDEFRS